MGNYNPKAPYVLGNEFVGIRNVNLVPSVGAEYGVGFTLTGSTTISAVQDYVAGILPGASDNHSPQISIYPESSFGENGPVQSVLIPVASVAGTGAALGGAPDTVTALQAPDFSDIRLQNYISLPNNPYLISGIWCRFDIDSYPFLANKRILNVNAIINWASEQAWVDYGLQVGFVNSLWPQILAGTATFGNSVPAVAGQNVHVPYQFTPRENQIIHYGSSTGAMNSVALATNERLPWTYADLLMVDSSAGSWYFAVWGFPPPAPPAGSLVGIDYLALQVQYCDETRLAVGGFSGTVSGGVNSMGIRAWPAKTSTATLPAGNYYATLGRIDPGDLTSTYDSFDTVSVNALRTAPTVVAHPGKLMVLPTPPENNIGVQSTISNSDIQPQLTLYNNSGAVVPQVQAYGRMFGANVYGNNVARQIILGGFGTGATYPWLRFYTRHFTGTSIPLTVKWNVTTLGTITASQLDAMDEYVDGWRVIDMAVPAQSVDAAPSGFVEFSASGEAAGSRWEVLGVAAPSITGIPGSLLTPGPVQLGTATYSSPVAGNIIGATWMPQGISGPYVSGSAFDSTADLVTFFGVNPPAVTGFSGSTQVQHLVGIGLDCLSTPCGIADSLYYNRFIWNTAPPSGANFGYYELQRMDALTDWQTIMSATTWATTGFNDYEARPGLQSGYRIRVVDSNGFTGNWSSTVNLTVASPGASGGPCFSQGHVLLFTSNEAQDGSRNLAYSSSWDGSGAEVEEGFSFPEAGFNQLQAMYNKNFFTAFRPLERGGEQFQRTVLVQAAAISPETLADFTSLRDMAWADLSYVCVRDEDGNRWFANVTVPDAKVRLNRTIYLASVNIAEVTDTASPVDP